MYQVVHEYSNKYLPDYIIDLGLQGNTMFNICKKIVSARRSQRWVAPFEHFEFGNPTPPTPPTTD